MWFFLMPFVHSLLDHGLRGYRGKTMSAGGIAKALEAERAKNNG